MCRYGGTEGRFDSLSLDGNFTASIGFLLRGQGTGTGHSTFIDFRAVNCSIGFQCGREASDANCADLCFIRARFEQCQTGFRVVNNQGMNYTFVHLDTRRCECALDFARGGVCNVYGWGSVRDRVLVRLGAQGANNKWFAIQGLKVDAQAPDDWMLADNVPANSGLSFSGIIAVQSRKPRSELLIGQHDSVDLSKLIGVMTAASPVAFTGEHE